MYKVCMHLRKNSKYIHEGNKHFIYKFKPFLRVFCLEHEWFSTMSKSLNLVENRACYEGKTCCFYFNLKKNFYIVMNEYTCCSYKNAKKMYRYYIIMCVNYRAIRIFCDAE